MDDSTRTTPLWRTHFADGDALRDAVGRLGLAAVEQRLLLTIVAHGHAGTGDLAGALVCVQTMDELAAAARRSSRTLRKRGSIERLAPFVERLVRPGTVDVLVCYPDRIAGASGIVCGSQTAPADSRERETEQRIDRMKRAAKRPLPNQPLLPPVAASQSQRPGLVTAVIGAVTALFRSGDPQPASASDFWRGTTAAEPCKVPDGRSGTSGSVRTEGPEPRVPSGRNCPDGRSGTAIHTTTATSLPPPQENSITATSDVAEAVISKMVWGEKLRAEQLSDADCLVHELFPAAVAQGVAADTPEDLRRFVALAVYVARAKRIGNRVALFTRILDGTVNDSFRRRDWRQFPSDEDLAKAKQLLAAREQPLARQPDAYAAELEEQADAEARRLAMIDQLHQFAAGRTSADQRVPAGVHEAPSAGRGGE